MHPCSDTAVNLNTVLTDIHPLTQTVIMQIKKNQNSHICITEPNNSRIKLVDQKKPLSHYLLIIFPLAKALKLNNAAGANLCAYSNCKTIPFNSCTKLLHDFRIFEYNVQAAYFYDAF